MSLHAARIAELVSGTLHGNPDAIVSDVSSLAQSRSGTLSFLSNAQETAKLASTNASVILIPEKCDPGSLNFTGEALIVTSDPFSKFISLLPHFRNVPQCPEACIHPTAVIDPTVKLGEGVHIGPHVNIDAHCQIGDGCRIHAGVSIGAHCQLASNVTLHPRVVLYANCCLGQNVIVHSSSVIGADGFGYQFQQVQFNKIPHYGNVILEDDVEIGACTTVDRGMFESTVIGRGTKIDNQVMIAHNCRIGEHNVIVSQVGLAGSVTTGNYCRFGGQVGIADHINIGHGASLMAQCGVFRDIPDGETVLGSPALPKDQQKKIMMAQIKLPEMRQAFRALEKQFRELQKQAETPQAVPIQTELKAAA